LAYYAPRWRRYSDDGRTVSGSCYGKAAFGGDQEASQWNFAKEILRSDPASRRAILIFDQPKTTDARTVDKACLTSMQFLIREGQLHAVVSMRSNDVFLGVPYDVFNFTMLHELMALDVGVELGRYVHFAGSLHLYETDMERAKRSFLAPANRHHVMEAIPSVESARSFAQVEAAVREGDNSSQFSVDRFWSPYVAALEDFRSARSGALIPTTA
jgi:thymidylate synthase